MQADHPLFTRLARALVLSEVEAAAVRAVPVQSVTFKADEVIAREGDRPSRSFLLAEGLTCVSKVVAGGKRQIMTLQIPGDAPDLHTLHPGASRERSRRDRRTSSAATGSVARSSTLRDGFRPSTIEGRTVLNRQRGAQLVRSM